MTALDEMQTQNSSSTARGLLKLRSHVAAGCDGGILAQKSSGAAEEITGELREMNMEKKARKSKEEPDPKKKRSASSQSGTQSKETEEIG